MNEAKIQEIINASPFGFAHHEIIVDSQGKPVDYRFLEVNPVFAELTGLEPGAITGKTVREVIPGIETGEFDWIGFYGKVALDGGDEKFEQFAESLGRWYQVHCYSCERGFFTTFFVDITEQKTAVEEKLRQAGLIRDLLSCIPDLIFFKDLNGVYLGCNPCFVKLAGKKSEEEIIGKTDYDLFDKEMADFFRYNDDEMLRQLTARQNEEEIVLPDGSKRLIDTLKTPYRDLDGNVIGILGISRDITARKQAEEELKQKNRMLEILMELAGTYISLPMEELEAAISLSLGRLGEVVGADRVYIFKYDDEKDTCSNTHEWCAAGVSAQIEKLQDVPNAMIPDWVETTRRGGSIIIPDVAELPEESGVRQILEPQGILSLLVIPMMNEGHCDGFVGFDSVRSHHVYGIEEQRLLNVFVQLLANVIRRRTMENALKNAVVQAEAASKAKSQFLANMSHEIRTPLNGVIGFTDLLKNTQLSKIQQEYVNNANISAHTLLGIINDILDFSKIEAGMLELEVVRTDMVELLQNSVDIVKLAAEQKGLEILLHIDQKMPRFAFVDPVRLKQILANLMGNAVKFTEKGEVELKVAFKEIDDGQGSFAISVRDTGIGISDSQKEKLFKAFSQADNSTTRKFGGTGLGLIISDMIAREMGSKINISSIPDSGSIFFFTINAAVEKGVKLDDTRIRHLKSALIIDDNANNRLILEKMLRRWQISCEACENGLEALKRIGVSRSFDVIICDYEMPYIDGLETIRIIREMLKPNREKYPVILMHSSDSEELRGKCDEMGVRFLLRKPVKSDDLFSYLNNLQKSENESVKIREREAEPGRLGHVGHKIRILVAEDVAMNMMLSKAILSQLVGGVEIFEAVNGLQAVEQYERIGPDLVLMDVQMPELDGVEATMRIREIEKATGRHVPIVALTAGALSEEREKCFAAGMDDFLAKPIENEKMKAVLDKHLLCRKKEAGRLAEVITLAEDHFRYDILVQNLGDEAELVWELIAVALEDVPEKMSRLEQACKEKDARSISAIAHSIKGAALTMRFTLMAEIAAKMEEDAKVERLEEMMEKIAFLKAEWELVKKSIGSLKGGLWS